MELTIKIRILWFLLCSIAGHNAVLNVTVTSEFPNSPLNITWNHSPTGNKSVSQYMIWIKNITSNQCLLWSYIRCSDCPNETSNSTIPPGNCTYQDGDRTFNNSQTIISIVVINKLVRPYTKYEVDVSTNYPDHKSPTFVNITTGQYKSGPIRNLTIDSSFPKNNLILYWLIPRDTRGLIINYYIFVYNNDSGNCRLFVNMTCQDCDGSVMTMSRESRNITCNSSTTTAPFNASQEAISRNITHRAIQPNTSYTVEIVPINGYGWGNETLVKVVTESYTPLNVSSFGSVVNGVFIHLFWRPPADDIHDFNYTLEVSQTPNNVSILSLVTTNYTYNGTYLCQTVNFCIWTETPYRKGQRSCISNHTRIASVVVNLQAAANNRSIAVNWSISEPSKCAVLFTVYCNESRLQTTNRLAYVITNLTYYTTYNITVIPTSNMTGSSDSVVGIGKSTLVKTPVGIPGVVRGFNCTNETFNAFLCSWEEPVERNGPSLIYILECKNETVIQENRTVELYSYFSTNVYPDFNYTCTIKARTDAGFGPLLSTSIQILASKTPYVRDERNIADVMGVSQGDITVSTIPIILPYSHFTEQYGRIENFTLWVVASKIASDTSLPGKTYADCNKGQSCPYEVKVPPAKSRRKRAVGASNWGNQGYVIGNGNNCNLADAYSCNGPLNSNTEYLIAFRVYTKTGFGTYGLIKRSTKNNSFAVAVAVPIVVVIVLSVCIALAIFMYRRRRNQPGKVSMRQVDEKQFLNSRATVEAFGDYYRYLRKDSWVRATQQFTEIITKWKEQEIANKLVYYNEEEKKNRYRNIKPYVHSMVTLKGPGTYINASRICMDHCSLDISESCSCSNCYIATQGPMGVTTDNKTATVGDFWRMTVQYNVRIIVNLTKCMEAYRDKCAQYWPDTVDKEETHVSGQHTVCVRLLRYETNKIFDERELLVSMDGVHVTIVQLHFTAWPDHDCPNVHDFLTFYRRFTNLRCDTDAVVVHCSAGVGRTGTFILIDIELRKAFSKSDYVEIYQTLLKLRHCRCLMVQVEKQYLFVHTIIYEFLKQNGMLASNGSKPNGGRTESTYSYLNPAFD